MNYQIKEKIDKIIFLRKLSNKSVFRQETGENIVWCRKRGQKCAARSLRFLCAHGAHSCVPLCKGLLSWFRKYHKRYFPHNKKDPCDRVRIGFTFAPLIWLCLKQGSLLQRPLRSSSYWVRLCTFDLIVFEARKHRLRGDSDCTGNVWGSDSVNYLHFRYPCWNGLNQCSLNIL